jgi:hypothetical protein
MTARIMITLCILLYTVGVPCLEVNETHIWNTQWPAHARLHNVWQLITNTLIGAGCLWLIWIRKEILLPAVASALVTGGFLLAFVLRGFYGGSMVHTDGSEVTILGAINIGVAGFGLGLLLLVPPVLLEVRRRREEQRKAGIDSTITGSQRRAAQ